MEESTTDVTGLHEKLDRMKSVEQHNKQTLESYEESFNGNVEKMIQDVQNYSTQQHNVLQSYTKHIGSTKLPTLFCFKLWSLGN